MSRKNNRCILLEIFIHAVPRYVESPDIFPFLRLSTMSTNFKLLNPDDSLNISEKLAIGSNNVPHNFIPRPHILFSKKCYNT